jgi:GTPase SAR1 family protein
MDDELGYGSCDETSEGTYDEIVYSKFPSKLDAEPYKVTVMGDSFVGKSSFLLQFTDGKFYEQVQATVGLDYVRLFDF